MSVRRKAGDVVFKKPGAGYTGEGCFGMLVPAPDRTRCLMECGDDACAEWPTLHVLDRHGSLTMQAVHHVSECEMGDVELLAVVSIPIPPAGPVGDVSAAAKRFGGSHR